MTANVNAAAVRPVAAINSSVRRERTHVGRRSMRRRLVDDTGRDFRQHDAGVCCIVQPMVRVFVQAAAKQPTNLRRNVGGELVEVGIGLEDRREGVGHGVTLEHPLSGQHFEQHAAERPDVGSSIGGFTPGLLRAHIAGGAENHSGDGAGRGQGRRQGLRNCLLAAGCLSRRCKSLGETEVEHLDFAVEGQLDVGRLEIAMDHAAAVRRLQRRGDLLGDVEGFVEWQRSAREPLREVLAFNQLHDQEGDAFFRTARRLEAVDAGDVRVVQRGQELRLTVETREALGVAGEGVGKQLDSDLAVEVRVDRTPDGPHPALADLLRELVVQQHLSRLDRHGMPSLVDSRIPRDWPGIRRSRIGRFRSRVEIIGAGGRARTCTALRPEDFKSPASTSSATPAAVDSTCSSAGR